MQIKKTHTKVYVHNYVPRIVMLLNVGNVNRITVTITEKHTFIKRLVY